MNDATQPDAIEPLMNATIGAPRLSIAQRQRHLARLSLTPSGAMNARLQPALAGTILDDGSMRPAAYREHSWRSRRGLAELTLVAAVAVLLVVGVVVVQERSRNGDSAQRGIPVEQLMGISSPLEPGQGLHAEFQMHADYRDDNSLLLDWSVERWQRVLPDGTEQERTTLRDVDGRELTTYIRNGDDWSHRDGAWVETGTLDVGFHTVTPYFGWSTSEPGMAARYLNLLADGFPAEEAPAAVETFTDERGDITRIEGLGDAASEDDNRRFGVTITAFYYELIHDPETGNLLQTRGFLASEEGVEITIAQWDFLLVETLPAEELDATLFDVEAEPEFPQYAAPEQLPGNLTLDSHIDDFLAGSERLVYTGNGMELIVNVSPPAGGYDPSGLIAVSRPGTIRGADSAVGPITWGGQEESSSPQFAYWDDGHNRFMLSVAGDAPIGWDVAALIAVVEALSSVATDT